MSVKCKTYKGVQIHTEAEKKLTIIYIEGQIKGIESVYNWIDGYYDSCITGKLQELREEINKLEDDS
jgi:hypothetical protein